MKVSTFLKKWHNNGFEDCGSETSDEYKKFQREYKSVLKDLLNDIGMDLYSFNKNHYDFSAVLQSRETSQFYYVSIPDVRYSNDGWANDILYRTMAHDKDWHGGMNRTSTLKELSKNLATLDREILAKQEKEAFDKQLSLDDRLKAAASMNKETDKPTPSKDKDLDR